MRLVLVTFFALIVQIFAHGQHGHGAAGGQAPVTPAPGQAHVTRKMEDYVHDME